MINVYIDKKNCENIYIFFYKEFVKNLLIRKVLGKFERAIYIFWNICNREKVILYLILYVEKFGLLAVEDYEMYVFGK